MRTAQTDGPVGPVLTSGPVAWAVVRAIRTLNDEVDVKDRGSYLRVAVPERCIVTRRAIEEAIGESFELPSDLERIMPSFRGFLHVTEEEVVWSCRQS